MIFLSNMPIFQLVAFTLWLIMTNRQSRVTLVVSPGRSKPSWLVTTSTAPALVEYDGIIGKSPRNRRRRPLGFQPPRLGSWMMDPQGRPILFSTRRNADISWRCFGHLMDISMGSWGYRNLMEISFWHIAGADQHRGIMPASGMWLLYPLVV